MRKLTLGRKLVSTLVSQSYIIGNYLALNGPRQNTLDCTSLVARLGSPDTLTGRARSHPQMNLLRVIDLVAIAKRLTNKAVCTEAGMFALRRTEGMST